jgi:putative transcription factor
LICELCGKETPRTRTVTVEGSLLSVCGDCTRFGAEVAGPAQPLRIRHPGNPVVAQRLEQRQRRMSERDIYASSEVGAEELVDDYGERIRTAREAKGWKQTDLGARINEKASVIAKLETNAMVPPDSLIPKLERALGIKLREKVEPVAVKKHTGREPLTLGDLVRMDEE